MLAGLPEVLAPMRRQGTPQRDTAPGMPSGAFVRYGSQDGFMTVFFGRRGNAPVPDGADFAIARQEFDSHTLVMGRAMMAANGGREVPRVITVGTDGPSGRTIVCNTATATTPQGSRHEAVCVAATLGRLLKIRLTTTVALPPDSQAVVGLIALGMIAEIRARLAGEPPPAAPPAARPRGGPVMRI